MAGGVERSVIGRGAVVEAGAVVCDSVLLPGAVVRAGATVRKAVLDDEVEICGEHRSATRTGRWPSSVYAP